MIVRLLLTLFLGTLLVSPRQEAEPPSIPIRALQDLVGEPAFRTPHSVAVDLDAYPTEHVTHRNGWTRLEEESGTWTGHRWLGTSSSGIHVFIIAQGDIRATGVFQHVLLTRMEESRVLDQGRSRVIRILRTVGIHGLGDRDDAGISMDGDRVTIGVSRYRDTPEVIDLATLD